MLHSFAVGPIEMKTNEVNSEMHLSQEELDVESDYHQILSLKTKTKKEKIHLNFLILML